MLSLPPLLLHALFPSFPPLWFILLSGAIIGVGLSALARQRRGPAISTLAAAREQPRRGRDSSEAPPSRLAHVRDVLGDEILGVPWTVPAYALLFVLLGGLLGIFLPPMGITLLPGYIAAYAIAFDGPALESMGWLATPFVALIMIGVSWAFWTGAAMVAWHLLRVVRNDPVPERHVRLGLGRRV